MNEVGLVVSRYYENLKWIEEITSNIDVYVYDRYGDSPGMGVPHAVSWATPKDRSEQLGGLDIEKCKQNGINLQVISIPDDPGFEASTYVYHMYSKYDVLNDYTVFVQGHPHEYVANIINILNDPASIKHTTYVESDIQGFTPAIRHVSDQLIDFEPFTDNLARLHIDQDYQWSQYQHNFNSVPWFEFCKDMTGSTFDIDGNWRPPANWRFGAGNQFVASKNAIRTNDIEYYKRLQHFINTYMDPNGENRPEWQQLNQGPNIMEGIWQYIFKLNN